jgi:hypothetical protein
MIAPAPASAPAFALVMLFAVACGYAPVHGGAPREKLAVVLAASSVADAVVADEVLAGVRDELAKDDALAPGTSYPRCEIEVLRADEASEGISASRNDDGRLLPASRATRVGVLARAWVARSAAGTPGTPGTPGMPPRRSPPCSARVAMRTERCEPPCWAPTRRSPWPGTER